MQHTPATKERLSAMRRGDRNPMFGRKHTAEARAKIAAGVRATGPRRTYVPSPQSVRIPEGIALGYLTAMVDGEGSIRFSAGRPFVAVYNTELAVIEWIIENVGGTVSGRDDRGRVPCYAWRISAARDVYAVCRALLPHLIVKRDDALTALAHLDAKYGEVMAGG